jgi:hypothetical protein
MSKKRGVEADGAGKPLLIDSDGGLSRWDASQSAFVLLPPSLVPGVWKVVQHRYRGDARGKLARAVESLLAAWEVGDRMAMRLAARELTLAVFEWEVLP